MSRVETAERSAVAYEVVVNSGLIANRASEVYASHYRHGAITKREMFAIYQSENPTSSVQVDSFGPRYRQLVDAGLMIEVGERECRVSKQVTTIWAVTAKVPTERLATIKELKPEAGLARIAQLEGLLAQANARILDLESRQGNRQFSLQG